VENFSNSNTSKTNSGVGVGAGVSVAVGGGGGVSVGVASTTAVSVGRTSVVVGERGTGVEVGVLVGKGVGVWVGISVAVGVGENVGAGDDSARANILVGRDVTVVCPEFNHKVKPDPTPASDNNPQMIKKRNVVTPSTIMNSRFFKLTNLSQKYPARLIMVVLNFTTSSSRCGIR
jgi:hypothetical protein